MQQCQPCAANMQSMVSTVHPCLVAITQVRAVRACSNRMTWNHYTSSTPAQTTIAHCSAPEPLLAMGIGAPEPLSLGEGFCRKERRSARHPLLEKARRRNQILQHSLTCHSVERPHAGAAHGVMLRERRVNDAPAATRELRSAPSSQAGRKHSSRACSIVKRRLSWRAAEGRHGVGSTG